MLAFQYTAREKTGNRVSGTLQATSEREAVALLDERGLVPIRVEAARPTSVLMPKRKRRPPGRVLARIYRQMSDLLRAGVPLLKTLELLEKQSSDASLGVAFAEVRKQVADGDGLAESLAKHPHLFNDLAISMIRAGQEGGFLEDVLARIADYTEQEEELKGHVAGAMAYPVFLALVGTLVISVLVVFFVPQFAEMFEQLAEKGELPGITVGLLATSDFLRGYGLILLGLLAVGITVFNRWRRTPAGKFQFDAFKLRMPKIGEILRALAIVRFTRVLGTLLANGIPILRALRIAKDSCGNLVLSQAIDRAADNVTSGESLTEPLRVSGCFPKDVVEMISIAEESNTMERVLIEISTSTEKRVTRELELFVKLLEPMMLMVMAGIVLVVVVALLLPVIKMSSAMS